MCGQCQTPLPVPSKPLTITDATFAADVERSPLPVLLDLWARVVRALPDDGAHAR